jgi:hypothetical protein
MPRVEDYFYEDLIPKAPELSQLFPTLCHDAYVVRRWLGPVGCAIYWTMVMEDINNGDVPTGPTLWQGSSLILSQNYVTLNGNFQPQIPYPL